MLIQTTKKSDCYRAFINYWLKDHRYYCNNCFATHDAANSQVKCCEDPQIGRNIDHTRGLIMQNKRLKETRKNEYASNDKRNLRMTVSLPPQLFLDLQKYMRNNYQCEVFDNQSELYDFMREFPAFSIPNRV